jgi:hypothetical protein
MSTRTLRFSTLLVAALLALSACGSKAKTETEPELHATADATPSTSGATVVKIQISGNTVTPAGTRVPVTKNAPVVLEIQSDKAGELHVHSSPEQHIEFPKGASALTLKFAQPGVIDVEDHALDKLIVQLEVR